MLAALTDLPQTVWTRCATCPMLALTAGVRLPAAAAKAMCGWTA